MTIFYDTNCLLKLIQRGEDPKPGFYISAETLRELENIKTSHNKDYDVKYNARKLTKWLIDHENDYSVCNYAHTYVKDGNVVPMSSDEIICQDAVYLNAKVGDVVFYTEDLSCRNIAKHICKLNVSGLESEADDYTGYKVTNFEDVRLPAFYMMLNEEVVHENIFDLLVNEYLLIQDEQDKSQYEIYYWDGHFYERVIHCDFKTKQFGTVKPYNNDPYQVMAMDCLHRNKISMLCGPGGSGKSYLALSYLFRCLEAGDIDKIVIFCNTVSTKNAARIGFLPGTRTEKLMESSIGNMLSSKLGDVTEVERLIAENKLVILPMCDIRGYDTTDMNAGVYITEAQNLDIELMKLALQRIGSDCFVIIDGDHEAQVDMIEFAGNNNGMKRMSKVFRGQNFYGEVKLNKIYRSRIAELAQSM